jgi:hypothetical protein
MGCSFVTLWLPRETYLNDTAQAVQVTNPNAQGDASITLYEVPLGSRDELPQGDVVVLGPGESVRLELAATPLVSESSILRTGGLWRVESDLPVAVHQVAPYLASPADYGGNGGGTLLLPEDAFRGDFVVAARTRKLGNFLSEAYFAIVALEDGTRVGWRPRSPTFGNGAPVPSAGAGERVEVVLNRYDWVRVHASGLEPASLPDVSGTVIDASAPVAAFSAVPCASVPYGTGSNCDHMQEQLLPLHFWGREYAVPMPPARGSEERFELRIFASGPGEVSEVSGSGLGPWSFAARGESVTLSLGAEELAAGQAGFVFEGDVAFMPVLYTRSQGATGAPLLDYGDPAMSQLPPVGQFLQEQAFSTPAGFLVNHLQLVRQQGSADVELETMVVESWAPLGDYEVATISLEPDRAYVARSADAFGSLRYGYSGFPGDILYAAGYASVGGVGFGELTTP